MRLRKYAIVFAGGLCALMILGGCAGMKSKSLAGAATHIEKASQITGDRLPPRPDDLKWVDIDEVGSAWGVVKRIHFDYDNSKIKKEWVQGLTNNAKFMKDNLAYVMRIEGHCDERGTNEYNLALGERRALEARKFLVGQGVEGDRVHIISYGEDRPVSFCHDESCWKQNRRADFLVAKKN